LWSWTKTTIKPFGKQPQKTEILGPASGVQILNLTALFHQKTGLEV